MPAPSPSACGATGPTSPGGRAVSGSGDRCRAAFHRGCRLRAIRTVDKGLLSIEAIKNAAREPYTAFLGGKSPSG